MQSEDGRLSTTALARKLEIPAQQLFVTLRDYGWIRRAGDSWALSTKGEYEGGTYRRSQRYGTYIVWPETLTEHPLLAAIESNQRITAFGLCRYYPTLSAQQINRVMAELGLQRHTLIGWELTPRGRALGGQQEEGRNSGALYATWPHDIVDNPIVYRELAGFSNIALPSADGEIEPDLFQVGASMPENLQGIDGHHLRSALQASVCNWLYLAQLAHAHRRALPSQEAVFADFYLPDGCIYIDCWESEVPAHELKDRLQKRDLYRELELRNLQIDAADADRLDDVLGNGLLDFGMRF
tara:strand:+ start:3519 stop:4409 length:891 start_codon:yes stop_codon:yes gene_type:complete